MPGCLGGHGSPTEYPKRLFCIFLWDSAQGGFAHHSNCALHTYMLVQTREAGSMAPCTEYHLACPFLVDLYAPVLPERGI